MPEYINRDEMLRQIERREQYMVGDKTISVDVLKNFVKNRPAADVEQIVRCKDCRYRGMIYCPAVHETMGNGLVDYTPDDGYCWRGRPKEVDND